MLVTFYDITVHFSYGRCQRIKSRNSSIRQFYFIQSFLYALAAPVVLCPVLKDNGNHWQPECTLTPHDVHTGQPINSAFQRNGYLLFHFLRSQSGNLSDHLGSDICNIRICFYRKLFPWVISKDTHHHKQAKHYPSFLYNWKH